MYIHSDIFRRERPARPREKKDRRKFSSSCLTSGDVYPIMQFVRVEAPRDLSAAIDPGRPIDHSSGSSERLREIIDLPELSLSHLVNEHVKVADYF